MSVVTFTAHGDPVPQGSKTAYKTPDGRVVLVEAAKRLRPWRRAVAMTALAAKGTTPTLTGPVRVTLTFRLRRPLSNRNEHPTGKPDLDKLTRAVLDACTDAHLWLDDAQVTQLVVVKEWASAGCVRVQVEPVP